jgi:hypothetical protein
MYVYIFKADMILLVDLVSKTYDGEKVDHLKDTLVLINGSNLKTFLYL